MKKTLLGTLLALILTFIMAFAGCGVSQGSADDINNRAENDNHYTASQLEDKFGEPTVDLGIWKFWVNGCEDLEDVAEKFDNGDKVEGLSVNFNLAGKAVLANYGEISKEDFGL